MICKGFVYTNFCIKLVEDSFSLRDPSVPIINPYLDGGRVRQERIIIHLGALCSIQITSNPYSKLGQENKNDFVVEIMNNTNVVDEDLYARMDSTKLTGKPHGKMNVSARANQLKDFINGGEGNSPFASHKDTVTFLSRLYDKIYDA